MSSAVPPPASGAELLQSIAAASPALHSHLTALISHLIQHRPVNPFQSLEKISSQLLSTPTSTPSPLLSDPSPELTAYLTSSPYLLTKQPPPPPTSDDEPTPEDDPPPPAFIPDVASLTALLHEAGLSLSDEESTLIDRAACQLTAKEGLDSLRFWGKLLTTSALDYYVFEGKKPSFDDDEAREAKTREAALTTGDDLWAGRELLGSGANEYVYYVTQTLATPIPTFTLLPSTAPRFIVDARATRRLLTGRLQAAVGGFPRFPGVEADLVRAQIARITQATVMVPAGSWKEEEGEVVIENEEWKGPVAGRPLGWVYGRGHLRREGRVEPAPEEEGEEEGEGGEAKAVVKAEVEAKRPLLAAAAEGRFTLRAHSALDVGGRGVEGEGEGEGGRVAVSSVVSSCWSTEWPGSVSVVRGKEYGSVYVGWGLKAGKGAERVDRLTPMEAEWEGQLQEWGETWATGDEEKKEREEEEERRKEEGDKKVEDDEDDLPADEEATKEEED